jgi:hypothetical protein
VLKNAVIAREKMRTKRDSLLGNAFSITLTPNYATGLVQRINRGECRLSPAGDGIDPDLVAKKVP